jgi:hypothetical protein
LDRPSLGTPSGVAVESGGQGQDADLLAIECLMLWLEPDRLSAIVHIVDNVLAGDNKVQMIANSNRLNVGLLNLSMLLLIDLAMQIDPTADPVEGGREILRRLALGLSEG